MVSRQADPCPGIEHFDLNLKRRRLTLADRFRARRAFLLSQILAHVDYVGQAIEAVSQPLGVLPGPFTEALERLSTIPGVKRRTAEAVIAEIGVDMRVFLSASHLASWAALCPGSNDTF